AASEFDEAPTILVDIAGGTPANTAQRYQQKHPDVAVYSGLSVPLLLAVVMGTPIDEAIKQAIDNMAPVGLTKKKEEPKKTIKKEETPNKNVTLTPHTMQNVRIDERLIHGQVATRSEEHTSELQSRFDLVCRLLLEKKTGSCNNDL